MYCSSNWMILSVYFFSHSNDTYVTIFILHAWAYDNNIAIAKPWRHGFTRYYKRKGV